MRAALAAVLLVLTAGSAGPVDLAIIDMVCTAYPPGSWDVYGHPGVPERPELIMCGTVTGTGGLPPWIDRLALLDGTRLVRERYSDDFGWTWDLSDEISARICEGFTLDADDPLTAPYGIMWEVDARHVITEADETNNGTVAACEPVG